MSWQAVSVGLVVLTLATNAAQCYKAEREHAFAEKIDENTTTARTNTARIATNEKAIQAVDQTLREVVKPQLEKQDRKLEEILNRLPK